jgi:RHS repeat-associated protein
VTEYDGNGNVQAQYTHNLAMDDPLSVQQGASTYYYHKDGLGSVTDLTSSAGSVVKRYKYRTFGEIYSETGSLVQPYTFTAREKDPETGLYYYRARYYDPRAGRFISKDPIGFAGGDANLFRYVKNNPLNFVDPEGEVMPTVIAGGVFGGALIGGAAGAIVGAASEWVNHNGDVTAALQGALTGAAMGAVTGAVAGGLAAAGMPSLAISQAEYTGASLFGTGFMQGLLSGEVAAVSSKVGTVAGAIGSILGPPVDPAYGEVRCSK